MSNKKKISIIGLGYVGFPTLLILSNVKKNKRFLYSVSGIEKNNIQGQHIQKSFYKRKKWIFSSDKKFNSLFEKTIKRNDTVITTDINKIHNSDIILVSIGFEANRNSELNFLNLCSQISKKIKKGALIIFESTLPPGTCNNLILPIFKKNLEKRGSKLNNIFLAYSYERVTPGSNYIDSIISSPRCYSGMNLASKKKCLYFLKSFIDTKKCKITEFNNLTECEASKVLENSYRAINIAFIDEWTKFAPKLKIDLLKIIDAIKLRSTHSNLMRPGIGVGGYCLTKDPNFINYSAKKILKCKNKFPIINASIKINKEMPQTSLDYVKSKINIKNKKILIYGMTYKEETNDTRNSPSLDLIKSLLKNKAKISVYDPWVKINKVKSNKFKIHNKFNYNNDIIIFTVAHKNLKKIKFNKIKKKTKIFDLNNCLTKHQLDLLQKKKIRTNILGRN